MLAETGRVALGCEYTGLSRQSAYALRARDALFAAGWAAACEIARIPLADALYEKAIDGVTDTIVKDGQVVATRHRFDSRLSVAVLHRLDKRCERAEDRGEAHLAIVRRWDEWLGLIGKGEDAAAQEILETEILETAPHRQLRQLAESAFPIAGSELDSGEDQGLDLTERCWKDGVDDIWLTDFPPPAGFTGYQSRPYDDERDDERYERACTADEIAALDADAAATFAAERAEDEELRDAWFEMLAGEGEDADPSPDPGSGADPDPGPTRHAELDSASIEEPRADAGETPADPDPSRDPAPDPDSAPDPG